MSNVHSVLDGASYAGAVKVTEAGVQGMITLRGDLSSATMKKAVKSAIGVSLPAALKINHGTKGSAAWMSPDELLIMTEYDQAEALVEKLGKDLSDEHHLAVNVSDARAVFTLTGNHIRDVLAKGTPADVGAEAFDLAMIRRSELGQVAAAFWLVSETEATVVCFRSVGEYMFNWLKTASNPSAFPIV